MKNLIAPCNLHADRTNSAINRRAPMEYLVYVHCSNRLKMTPFWTPSQSLAYQHVRFVSSGVRSNMVWLLYHHLKKNQRHSVSLGFVCDRKLLSFFFGLIRVKASFETNVVETFC